MEGKAKVGTHKYALVLPKGTFVYATPESGDFGGLLPPHRDLQALDG